MMTLIYEFCSVHLPEFLVSPLQTVGANSKPWTMNSSRRIFLVLFVSLLSTNSQHCKSKQLVNNVCALTSDDAWWVRRPLPVLPTGHSRRCWCKVRLAADVVDISDVVAEVIHIYAVVRNNKCCTSCMWNGKQLVHSIAKRTYNCLPSVILSGDWARHV